MCVSMVGMKGGARCQGFGLLGGQPRWACWGRGGTQERSGVERGGPHRLTGLFSSRLPHPSHYEGPLCPLKASFFPGVQLAAPRTEGCHLWGSGGHSFRREASTAHGAELLDRSLGTPLCQQALSCSRGVLLSLPVKGAALHCSVYALPLCCGLGKCDETGVSGLDRWEGLPAWTLRAYLGLRQDPVWIAPSPGRPSQS